MLDSLPFPPVDKVQESMAILRLDTPEELSNLVYYFDSIYVSGTFRSVRSTNGKKKITQVAQRFSPTTWNVHDATLSDQARTNNYCEGWNNCYQCVKMRQQAGKG